MSLQKLLISMICSLLIGGVIQAQVTVNGTVSDIDGETLIGATVLEKGTTNGTATDENGQYTITVSNGATIVISYTGYSTIEETVSTGGTMDFTLSTEGQMLEEVFVTATSKPIRRIEATTAVEAISAKEIERMNPVSVVDLVRFTPGMYVQTQAGRVRNFVFTRGFPDASSNGLIYTSLMQDGVRTFASPEMVADGSFRNDLNIGKVEVVRGSAATLYGRGAAAGAINIISKTGATETEGALKATIGQYGWLQFDANINGPLNASKTWRYNVGGFYLNDDGFRENLFPDKGGQVRANIDHIFPNNKGNLRIYGGAIDLAIQNMLSIPYAANDLTKPAGNWTSRMIELKPGNPFEGSSWPINNPASGVSTENEYEPSYGEGNFSKGNNFGVNLDYDLGNGFKLINKTRFQKMNVGIGFDFPINANFGDTQTKIIFGGGETEGGSNSKDFIQELRLLKSFDSENADHNITVGGYYSDFNVLVASAGSFYSQNTADPENPTYNRTPFGFPFNQNFRNGDYNELTSSFFFGYEGKYNDKLTLSVGGRFDKIKLDLTDNYRAGQENLNVKHDHDGFSWSLGMNYLIDPLTAIYGNYASSFRAPDYSAYTAVQYIPMTTIVDKPRVENNEEIRTFEIGFRKSTRDFSIDAGFFNTNISNRTLSQFVGAIATQVPVGDNRITGAEVSLIYTPESAKGLYLRSSFTLQGTKYTSFIKESPDGTVDLSGNKIANIPPIIFNFSAGYSNDKISINWNNNLLGARPIDVYNTADYPSVLLMDANVSYNITEGVSIKVGAQNLTNVTQASSVISAQSDNSFYNADKNGYTGNFANVRGVPYLPRRFFGSVLYKF